MRRWLIWLYVSVVAVILYLVLSRNLKSFHQNSPGYIDYDAVVEKGIISSSTLASKIVNDSTFIGNLSESRWLKIFPNLKKVVQKFQSMEGLPSLVNCTDPKHTVLTLRQDEYRIGGELLAEVNVKDFGNNLKLYGGDIFQAILVGKQNNTRVSCNVDDHMNGTYRITCPLLWHGISNLYVKLVHSSESLYRLMQSSMHEKEPFVLDLGKFRTCRGKLEEFECATGLHHKIRLELLCDYSINRISGPWFCVKPPGCECSPILWQRKLRLGRYSLPDDDLYFNSSINYRVDILGSGAVVNVVDIDSKHSVGIINAEFCSPSVCLDPMIPSGWVAGNEWKSLISNNMQHKNHTTFANCMHNRIMYIIGDSTMYQWFKYITKSLEAKIKLSVLSKNIWSCSRSAYSIAMNTTIHYRSHGPPLHMKGPPECRPFISDTIDKIVNGGRETVILFSIGIHYSWLDPDLYLDRLNGIKSSIERLLKRLSGVKIYIKGFHTNLPIQSWLHYRFEVMLRYVFRDLEGVIHIDLWDMSVILNNTLKHPLEEVINNQINYFYSIDCLPP